jgi:hypothetical protein
LQARLDTAEEEKLEGQRELEEVKRQKEEQERLVQEWAEERGEGRRKTMARAAESECVFLSAFPLASAPS